MSITGDACAGALRAGMVHSQQPEPPRSPSHKRNPKWDRLDIPARRTLISALNTLRQFGVDAITSVEDLVAELASAGKPFPPTLAIASDATPERAPARPPTASTDASYQSVQSPASPAAEPSREFEPAPPQGAIHPARQEELVRGFRTHLRTANTSDVRAAVDQWVCSQSWWWSGPDNAAAVQPRTSTVSADPPGGGEAREAPSTPRGAAGPAPAPTSPASPPAAEEDHAHPPKLVEGVLQTVEVLDSTLRRYVAQSSMGCGAAAEVKLEVAKQDSLSFGPISDCFRRTVADLSPEEEASKPVVPHFVEYPTRTKVDEFRGKTTKKRVLMQVCIRLNREASFYQSERQFELHVNLLGECSYMGSEPRDAYNAFIIITAQGQLRRGGSVVAGHDGSPLAGASSGRDAVTRCGTLVEAFHRFKVALVRATEHTIHHVVHGDFMSEMEHKMRGQGEVATTLGMLDAKRHRGSLELKAGWRERRARPSVDSDPEVEAEDDVSSVGHNTPLVRSWSVKVPLGGVASARPPNHSPRPSTEASRASLERSGA